MAATGASPLSMPTVGNSLRILNTPIYLFNDAGESFLIIDTQSFTSRKQVDVLEERRFRKIRLLTMDALAIPWSGKVLDHPIRLVCESESQLLSAAQLLASSQFDSVDDIMDILDGLAKTLELTSVDDDDPISIIDLRGVQGELLLLQRLIVEAVDEEERRAIVLSHHMGQDHDYDFSMAPSEQMDSKVFGTSDPYRAYLTSEELHSNDQAVLMMVGLRTLEYNDPEGTTIQSLWSEIIEEFPEAEDHLSDWIEPYLLSEFAQSKSFRVLDAHPPKAILVGEIPAYEHLVGLESPFQRIREIPLHLDGAPGLTEELFELSVQRTRGS